MAHATAQSRELLMAQLQVARLDVLCMISTSWDLGTCICIHDALLSGLMVNLGRLIASNDRCETHA